MSKLYYKDKTVLFECDRKMCGNRCVDDCHLTTEIEHARKLDNEQEYDVAPAPEEQSELYYIAVPVKSGNRNK